VINMDVKLDGGKSKMTATNNTTTCNNNVKTTANTVERNKGAQA